MEGSGVEPLKGHQSEKKTRIKIVMHCPDGCFPYLTPHLLHQCFPSDMYDNLELGISAQDSSVAPIYGRGDNKQPKKPSGFSLSPFVPDAWIRAYPKIALPTFDPFNIVPSPKNVRCGTAKMELLHINTMNGRIPVTHEDYGSTMMGAGQFQAALSLFECPSLNAKDRMHVLERNLEWCSAMLESPNVPNVWLPISIGSVQNDVDVQEMVDSILSWIDEQNSSLSMVCCVDWHLVKDVTQRSSILRILDRALPSSIGLALLAVNSIELLTNALHFANETGQAIRIGTNLPTVTAQQYQVLTIQRKDDDLPSSKKPKFEATFTESTITSNYFSCTSLQPVEPPNAHNWFDDPGPIDTSCPCMTCQEHSRSYLYHLACSKELLVEILLFVHNLHQILHVDEHLAKR